MREETTQLPEAVTISVERLMRFCYLAQMALELAQELDAREEGGGGTTPVASHALWDTDDHHMQLPVFPLRQTPRLMDRF